MDDAIKVSFGRNITPVCRTEEGTLYRMEDKTGVGTMEVYHVFPGIELVYNDFHMETCLSEFYSKVPLLGIDHCKEGRIEWEMTGGSCLYLQEGDLQVSGKRDQIRAFGFPLSHYHGITVGIYVDDLDSPTRELLEFFGVSIDALYRRYCSSDTGAYLNRADDSISRLFEELYATRGKYEASYLQIKVVELLYLLQGLDAEGRKRRGYFSKKQVDIVKQIAAFLTANLERDYTIEELAGQFCIPQTSMKLCFRGVYGSPIGQYLRNYRMNTAAKLLREGNMSVAAVAGAVGYDNQSKFAAAFKAVIGSTPTGYQKLSVRLEPDLPSWSSKQEGD